MAATDGLPFPPDAAGIDEAGRGPLAGPVVVAAVMLDPAHPIAGLRDSKRLTPSTRRRLADTIRRWAAAWAVVHVDVETVDRLNILEATLLGMARAVDRLSRVPALAVVDGNRLPALSCPGVALPRADARVPAVSAAAILAKVERDTTMAALDARFPGYGFAAHKGYPTRAHLAALDRLGPCPAHRRSFAPVRACLDDPERP